MMILNIVCCATDMQTDKQTDRQRAQTTTNPVPNRDWRIQFSAKVYKKVPLTDVVLTGRWASIIYLRYHRIYSIWHGCDKEQILLTSQRPDLFSSAQKLKNTSQQDCFLQKEARVCVSNAFVIEDSKFKWFFLLWKLSKWQRKQIC